MSDFDAYQQSQKPLTPDQPVKNPQKEADAKHVQTVTPWVIGNDSLSNQGNLEEDLKRSVDELANYREMHRKKTEPYMMGEWSDKVRDLLADADKAIREWCGGTLPSERKTANWSQKDANLSHWQ